jgi:hypothetical protein
MRAALTGPFHRRRIKSFNATYVVTLKDWGLFADGLNPVARSNVCPELDPPSVPSFYAFSFTVKAASARPTAVIAGSGEASEGRASYESRTIRFGDTSAEAMRDKLGENGTVTGSAGLRVGRYDASEGLYRSARRDLYSRPGTEA